MYLAQSRQLQENLSGPVSPNLNPFRVASAFKDAGTVLHNWAAILEIDFNPNLEVWFDSRIKEENDLKW